MLMTAVVIAAFLAAAVVLIPRYPRHAYLSGWVMFGLMLVLTFFNLRKRVPFLRLGSVSLWLRIHLVLGMVSGAVFFAHIGWTWPAGVFHQVLAWCFVVVFVSGLVGWWMSRSFPKKLTISGYETPYERIPDARMHLREEAEALMLASTDGQTSPVTIGFYTGDLGLFFSKTCNWWAHLRQSKAPQAAHTSRFDEVERYAKTSERETLGRLRELVSRKHLLDYQYSLQSALRLWLFVHIPFSYALLVFSVLHIVLVHAFSAAVS